MSYLKITGEPWELDYMDKGRSGVILWLNELRVLKAPIITYDENATEFQKYHENCYRDENIEFLDKEKAALQRLGHHKDIVEWYVLRPDGIEMKCLPRGSLAKVLMSYRPPARQLHGWFVAVARAIAYAHSRKVVVGDVARRNVLIDETAGEGALEAKLCDFTDAAVFPAEADMRVASQDGTSIHTDVFQFGILVYEVVTGKEFKIELFDATTEGVVYPRWPDFKQLPPVPSPVYGTTVLKCWNRGFENMSGVIAELEAYGRMYLGGDGGAGGCDLG